MAPRPALVKQVEATRAFKAWKAAFASEPRVEFRPDGSLILLPANDKAGDPSNDWDK